MAKLLDGKEVAASIIKDCAERVSEIVTESGLAPKLCVICVGDSSSNASYLKGIENRAAEAGVLVGVENLDENISFDELKDLICELNDSDKVDGILLMRPLPGQLKEKEAEVCELIAPDKDVDAARQLSVAGPFLGNNAFAPCTAESCMAILKHYDIDVAGKKVVVIGRSLVVGKPVANMLLNENATVTVCHSKTKNMQTVTKKADIVVVATGTARKFDEKYFSKGQIVIDAGIN